MTLRTNRAPLLCYFKICKSFQNHWWIQTGVTVQKRSIWLKISNFFCHVWPWNLTDDLEKNWTPLLCYFKIWASFHSHLWNQTGVTVRKIPTWVKIDHFFSPVTLKFDRGPWKTIGHFFYATSNFMHHFIAICAFKLELQSRNAQFGSKLRGFFSCVTLKFDRWPWKSKGQHQTLCIISSPYVKSNWSYGPEVGFWPL